MMNPQLHRGDGESWDRPPTKQDRELLSVYGQKAQQLGIRGWESLVPSLVELDQWVRRGYDRSQPGHDALPQRDRLGDGLPAAALPDLSPERGFACLRAMKENWHLPARDRFRKTANLIYAQPATPSDREKIVIQIEEFSDFDRGRLSMRDAGPVIEANRSQRGG